MTNNEVTGDVRVRVIAQETERVWCELLMHDVRARPEAIDVEVLYPDGTTVRYARELD